MQPRHKDFNLQHIITSVREAGVLRLTPTPEGDEKPLRKVVVLHGLASSKEDTLTTIYRIAQAGFDVIGIDLFMHGDRPEAANRDKLLETEFLNSIYSIIYKTAEDVPRILKELEIDYATCGVLGISTGGFVAHVLATQSPQMKALVAAISSPDWVTIDPNITMNAPLPVRMMLEAASPVGHAKKYASLPLLQMHGLVDERVRPAGAIKLDEILQPIYKDSGLSDRIELVTYPELGHYFTDDMLARSIAWFDKYL